jgi:hypothetical protein
MQCEFNNHTAFLFEKYFCETLVNFPKNIFGSSIKNQYNHFGLSDSKILLKVSTFERIVVIGGLAISTLLTLVVVPVIYELFHFKKSFDKWSTIIYVSSTWMNINYDSVFCINACMG